MVMHERPDKKYDTEKLREDMMPYRKAVKEVVIAVAKLRYELFHFRENSIGLMKVEPKKTDIFLMTIVGTPEEITALQSDERISKFLK